MRRPAEQESFDSVLPHSKLIRRSDETRCAVLPTAVLDTPDARRSAVAASARSHAGCRGDSRRPADRYVDVCLFAAHALELGLGGTLTVGAYRRSLRDGIGTGRPGIEDELRELGLPVVTPGQRLSQVRDTVTSLRRQPPKQSWGTRTHPDMRFPRSLRLSISVGSGKAMVTTSDEGLTASFQSAPGHPRRGRFRQWLLIGRLQ